MNFKVLINASNLHSGGGVQVATSFVSELLDLDVAGLDIQVWISSEVASSLESIGIDSASRTDIYIKNMYGISAFFSEVRSKVLEFDLVFTVFGPNYWNVKGPINLVGFAQPWILDDSVYKLLPPINRFKSRVKFFLQKIFFKSADAFIVELEHVRDCIYKKGIAEKGSVYVVYNCISSLYLKPEAWMPLEKSIIRKGFNIGFVGRDYLHKNTVILPVVKRLLSEDYNIEVEFFVTLTDLEWASKSEDFRSSISNVGSLSVAQCPSFYHAMDAIIFPSLLECFSATPLEAMAMKKPLFASDRRFVRDVCGDFAFYFDPLDPDNVANVIARYVTHTHGKDVERLALGREHAINFSSAKARAEGYIDIIKTELAKKLVKPAN